MVDLRLAGRNPRHAGLEGMKIPFRSRAAFVPRQPKVRENNEYVEEDQASAADFESW